MLGVVLAGAFIGLFGKVVIASGLDIPVWLVMACGAGGAVSGWLLFGAITVEASPASEWLRWSVASVFAAVVVTHACLAFRGDESDKR
jgi:anti-sigma factor RsiW